MIVDTLVMSLLRCLADAEGSGAETQEVDLTGFKEEV